jgi:hypothetical protein
LAGERLSISANSEREERENLARSIDNQQQKQGAITDPLPEKFGYFMP